MGLKAGLEIHQQLDTGKLFSRTPSLLRNDEPDYEVSRKLHRVAGESGEVDVAVEHEAILDKEFIYQGYNDTISLVELDEAPPQEIDVNALNEAIKIALLTLKESIAEFSSDYKEILAGEIGKHLSGFTGGKYSRLSLDDDFVPTVSLPEQEDIETQRLSVGTRDQLFFAMRLALSAELARNTRFPFILDDPFVNFDDERLNSAIDVLKRISTGRQIIILSHDQRLARLISDPIRL